MWICPDCRQANDDSFQFCTLCGCPKSAAPAPRRRSLWWLWLLVGLAVLASAAVICYFAVHLWHPANCVQAETCTICGKERAPAWGHDWCEWQTQTEPDCEFSGAQIRTCLRCGATETREIPPLGHLWAEATESSPRTCLRCGRTEGEPLPAAELPVETPAEQTAPGESTVTRQTLAELRPSGTSASGGFAFYQFGHDNNDVWYDNAVGGSLADTDNWMEYELNGEYISLSGTVYMNYDFRSETARHVKLSIYGDGKLLYSSAVISKGVQPESFQLDLTGVQTLRLVIYGNDYLRLSDCLLERSGS